MRSWTCAAIISSIAGLAGCVNAVPGAQTAALSAQEPKPGVATEAETAATIAAIETGAPARAGDVKIAAREARQSRESGTISGSAAIDRMIEAHARKNDIPPALAYAVVRVESRYNPKAKGGSALGLSQILPATARSMGFSGPSSRLYDADTNLTYGMKYLKGAWEKSGHDVCRTSMKYKGGHRATRMTSSALRYCSKVKAHMAEIVERRRAPALERQRPAGDAETLVAAVAPAKPKPNSPAAAEPDAAVLSLAAGSKPQTVLEALSGSSAAQPSGASEPVKSSEEGADASSRKGGRLVTTAVTTSRAIDRRMANAFAD